MKTPDPASTLDRATQTLVRTVMPAPQSADLPKDFSTTQWALAQLDALHEMNVLPMLPEADFADVLVACGETLKARGFEPKLTCLSWGEVATLEKTVGDMTFKDITALQNATKRYRYADSSHERDAWVVAHPQHMRGEEIEALFTAVASIPGQGQHPIILVPCDNTPFRRTDLGGWVHKAVLATQQRMDAQRAFMRLDDQLPQASQAIEPAASMTKAPRM